MIMSYKEALEAAGAEVHRYKYFGDYTGTILAEVTFEGLHGYVAMAYGSCEVCDPWEAFISRFDENWDHEPTREQLAEFGSRYLDSIENRDELTARYKEQADWDTEADDVLKWLKEAE